MTDEKTPDLTAPQRDLLAMLRAALQGEPAPAELAPRLESFLPLAQGHAVVPLLAQAFSPLPEDPSGPWGQVRRKAGQCAAQYYHLLALTQRLVRQLGRAGIEVVVLKGAGAAADYPLPEARKSGDVDLLLACPEDLDRACRVLEAAGARREEHQHARHHVDLVLEEGIHAELHAALTEDFAHRRVDRRLEALQREALSRRAPREVFPGVALPLLDRGGQALSLLLHMLSHFRGSGFGLKLLCDWTAFWSHPVPEEDLRWFLQAVSSCGLAGFTAGVTALCADWLGLPPAATAPLLAGQTVSPETREALLQEIFAAQEFGKQGGGRLVLAGGGGPAGYVREFHRQTRRNFPRAGKVPLLWPGLWVATLARFLRNNRRLRGVRTGQVLQSASRRGRLARQLSLFRR